MLSLIRAGKRLSVFGLASLGVVGGLAQSAIIPQAGEYRIIRSMPGDQVMASVALNNAGGYLVWEDNVIDGDGVGIAALRLDPSFVGVGGLAPLRINDQVAGDQERPQVALLKSGGAVFVWQSRPQGNPIVYARFLASDGTFATTDIKVSSFASTRQEDPQVAALADGTAVVVWSSFGQDGSLDGVFAQHFAPDGTKIGTEFGVTQTTEGNQHQPSVAALDGGRFVVVWVSESPRGLRSNTIDPSASTAEKLASKVELWDVSVYARIFDSAGPSGGEFKLNTASLVCANPSVAALPDGSFTAVWSEYIGRADVFGVSLSKGWDIFGRSFAKDGTPRGDEGILNETTFGDQLVPKLASFGQNYLALWTSLGQDGSGEGVYGRAVGNDGTPLGSEFRANSTTIGPQKFPAVASNPDGKALVVWSSSAGGLASFDLFAQRYSAGQGLPAPGKPVVSALSSTRLSVAWPTLDGFSVASYGLYIDGAQTPVVLTSNYWSSGALDPSSAHSYAIDYVLTDSRHSPMSAVATGTTWGEDANFDGLPDDWQAAYWGPDPSKWPAPNVDSDGDGASNAQEFLAGTNPTDKSSVLKMGWLTLPSGTQLTWNTQQGLIYQVQVSNDLRQWANLGQPRFAAGKTDSIPAGSDGGKAIYRVIRVR